MARSAAATWDAENTDAKGYWVSKGGLVDSIADVVDAFEPSLDVPEFTLSAAPSAPRAKAVKLEAREEPLARWEVIDTQIPDDAFDELPTEEAVLPEPRVLPEPPEGPVVRKANVLVARPMPKPQPTATAPAPASQAPAAPMDLDARRALALEMAARAKRGLQVVREPGSLPPVESLVASPPAAPVALPERSQERWEWDEADPLAVVAPERSLSERSLSERNPSERSRPELPSLSLVQAPETSEELAGILATPLPAPPRPSVVVPWPLPAMRPTRPALRVAPPVVAPEEEVSLTLDAPEALDDEGDDLLDEEPAASGAWMWFVAGASVLTAGAVVAATGVVALAAVAFVVFN